MRGSSPLSGVFVAPSLKPVTIRFYTLPGQHYGQGGGVRWYHLPRQYAQACTGSPQEGGADGGGSLRVHGVSPPPSGPAVHPSPCTARTGLRYDARRSLFLHDLESGASHRASSPVGCSRYAPDSPWIQLSLPPPQRLEAGAPRRAPSVWMGAPVMHPTRFARRLCLQSIPSEPAAAGRLTFVNRHALLMRTRSRWRPSMRGRLLPPPHA